MSRTAYFVVIVIVSTALGCQAEDRAPERNPTRAEAKAAARLEVDEPRESDLCAESGWYGDLECDEFCPAPDPDCVVEEVDVPAPPDTTCACAEIWAPVCGADGLTYGNECEAGCAGVAVAAVGECAVVAPPSPSPSPDPGCSCPDIYGPVCGTDGVTYDNDCWAGCAGVGWADGACGAPADTCPNEWWGDGVYCDECLVDDPDCL